MADSKTFVANAPAWIDLSSKDPAGSKDFYSKLFGWKIDEPRADAGGYMLAKQGGKDVAGLGPTQDPNQPTAWSIYIGTRDADATAKKVEAAGGKVIAPAFDVFDQGRMAVFQDPSGAFFSAWQAGQMTKFVSGVPTAYGWAELNARGLDRAVGFYETVFGWTTSKSPLGEGQEYTQFEHQGEPIAGALEMNPGIPAEVPSYWMVYFIADDVDGAYRKALDLGAREMVAPADFPGGRYAIISDPQGATFGLMSVQQP